MVPSGSFQPGQETSILSSLKHGKGCGWFSASTRAKAENRSPKLVMRTRRPIPSAASVENQGERNSSSQRATSGSSILTSVAIVPKRYVAWLLEASACRAGAHSALPGLIFDLTPQPPHEKAFRRHRTAASILFQSLRGVYGLTAIFHTKPSRDAAKTQQNSHQSSTSPLSYSVCEIAELCECVLETSRPMELQ